MKSFICGFDVTIYIYMFACNVVVLSLNVNDVDNSLLKVVHRCKSKTALVHGSWLKLYLRFPEHVVLCGISHRYSTSLLRLAVTHRSLVHNSRKTGTAPAWTIRGEQRFAIILPRHA